MRFRTHGIPQSGGGIGGIFRPIIKFFQNVIAPAAKSIIKSNLGQKGIKALKKAAVGITADAILGGVSKVGAKLHIDKARTKVAQALLDTQKRSPFQNSKSVVKRKDFYNKKKQSSIKKSTGIKKRKKKG